MLGARFENNGVRFRVWAPNADKAFVAYDGHWDQATAFELTRNGEYFEGFIAGAAIGLRYKFIFVENEQPVWRIDPAARDTTHSGLSDPNNGGFVVNSTFQWPPFRTPRFEDLIMYQLHAGTFAGMNDHFASRVRNGSANISFLESQTRLYRGSRF